jgi:hypothetical protein
MFGGGDGYTVLASGTDVAQAEPGDDLLQVAIDWISAHSPVDPVVEGGSSGPDAPSGCVEAGLAVGLHGSLAVRRRASAPNAGANPTSVGSGSISAGTQRPSAGTRRSSEGW